MQVIGLDLGGTAIKAGRFNQAGDCLQALTVATVCPPYPDQVLAQMAAAIASLDPEHTVEAIGVGTPGPTDAAGRIARIAINLPGWIEVPVADYLEAQLGRPTVVANDANCACLGEAWLGAGRPFRDLVMVTLGTGVGGAVMLNGQLFLGRHGAAAEPGLVTLNPEGPPCNSGNRGSLEQYCSVRAVRRQTGQEPSHLAARARAGDADAIAFWQQYGRWLGAGLASSIYLLTPEAIILGGGLSASADLFLPSILTELQQRVMATSYDNLQVCIAQLGSQAGRVGAARLALLQFGP